MKTIPAREMKQRFNACIEAAQTEPVLVERSGRPSVVVLSVAEYERLKALEDLHWAEKAQEAPEEGFLAEDEAAAWFAKMQTRLAE